MTRNLNHGVELPTDTSSVRPPKEAQETGTLNYVLLGSDSRDPGNEGNGRSDTIMLVHLNAKRTKAYIVSFPRDMYVNFRDTAETRSTRHSPSAVHRLRCGPWRISPGYGWTMWC